MSDLPDRRSVLKGAGAAAVVAGTTAFTACGGGAEPAAKKTEKKPAAPVTIPRSQVPAGNGVVLQEAPYVVTQPEAGTYKAFTKACPHQGCSVSFVKNRQIVCACHSSEFDMITGERTSGPAKTGLTEFPVKVDGDNLTIGG